MCAARFFTPGLSCAPCFRWKNALPARLKPPAGFWRVVLFDLGAARRIQVIDEVRIGATRALRVLFGGAFLAFRQMAMRCAGGSRPFPGFARFGHENPLGWREAEINAGYAS